MKRDAVSSEEALGSDRATVQLGQPVTLSPCHLVTLSPATLSPVTLSPCHLVTLSLLALLVLGCGGGAPATRPAGADGNSRGDDPLEVERDIFRKASDAASLREALQVVNSHLNDLGSLREIQAKRDQELPPERLRELLGLEPEELDYLQAATFQPLDAHYLAEAFELHEAAQGLQIDGLPALQQAERAFQWVMRQVVLHGDRAEWVPSHYVLLGGQGSAQERALVFLTLLQQLGLDGCLVAFPGEGQSRPRLWAVGVLIEDKTHRDIYLFDTRLGLPLPRRDGQGIATLAQLKAQPDVLRPLNADKESAYDVAPEQVRNAALYLAPSLSALAPRMKLLEDRLPSFGIRLSVDPARLVTRLEAAAQTKIQAWPAAAKRTAPPPSTPARALRRFVPEKDGGLDRTAKAQRYEQRLLPLATVAAALRELHLEDLPSSATQRLYYFADTLYMKYIANPRDILVRGRLDETTRALVQILSILREFDEARMPEGEFVEKVADWRERVKQAQIQVIRQVPDADKALESLWFEDQHLYMLLAQGIDNRERGTLLAPTADNRDEHEKPPKKILSFLVMRSVQTPLHRDASYLLALCWQEKAERVQTQRLRHASHSAGAPPSGGDTLPPEGGTPAPKAEGEHARTDKDKDQASAWLNVQDWWQKYANQYPFSIAAVNNGVKDLGNLQIRQDAALVEVLDQVDKFVGRWEWFCRDLHLGFQARLLQASGLEKAGKSDAARAGLQSLISDLDELRRDQQLSQAVDAALKRIVTLRTAVARAGGPDVLFADMQTRLTDLQRDLAPGGSFSWVRATAAYRLRHLQ